MPDELISTLFEAITTGDQLSLERCLETATIETVLEFEKLYGESPVHLCVKLAGDNCVPLVKRLFASGLVDGDLCDGEGNRLLECARASGDLELVQELIKIQIDGLDDATGCYRMMKCGSLVVFRLYLSLTGWNEQDTFRSVASALVRINVKSVVLPEELRVYLLWLLSDYGYRQLAGDWQGVKDPHEWRRQVATVADCWRVVKEKYDTRAYGDVDDGLLHRLEVIHNHLYFLKHKRFLRHLPLQEAVFCVAIFISTYRNASQFHEYRLVVNKCFVIDVLRMVCRQLEAVARHLVATENELIALLNQHNPLDTVGKDRLIEAIRERVPHLGNAQNMGNRLASGRRKGLPVEITVAEAISDETVDLRHLLTFTDRRVVRMLLKRYVRTKQLYSLFKMAFYCNQIPALEDVEPPVRTACMKRVVQVFGETVKNTKNTPNLPGKVERSMGIMLTQLFPTISKELREILSHSFSLKKLLLGAEHESKMFKTVSNNFLVVRAAFQLLYVTVIMEVRNEFYGLLYRCGTIESLRSLVLYAGDQEALAERQQAYLGQVKKHFDEFRKLLTELSTGPVGSTTPLALLQHQLKVKDNIIEEVEKFVTENDGFSYGDVAKACIASTDLASVRRLLSWKVTMRWGNKMYSKIFSSWKTHHVESMTIEWMDWRLVHYNPSVTAGILKIGAAALKSVEEFDYIVHTRQLAEDIGIADRVDPEALQELNNRLKPYYDNIFFVDNKWKVLKAFCKARRLGWNEESANRLLKRDRERLQELFDGCRTELQGILAANHLRTVDALSRKLYDLPPHVLATVEYCQLELCEMLVAVGYFGDSFHYLKHRIPMIQGTNYRNCLAHDPLSYNLLTDSSMEKIVINAFVIANTEIRLFDKQTNRAMQPDVLGESFPTVADTHRWVEEQEQLMAAFRTDDVRQIHALVQAGSEITSQFCCSPNDASVTRGLHPLTALVNPCTVKPAIVQFLDRYFSGFADMCNNPAHQVEVALGMYDFQSAFDRSIGAGDRLIRESLFRWPELMASVRRTDLFVHLLAAANRHRILSKLIEHGNETSIREILPFFDRFHDADGRGPLGDAMLYSVRSIAELLLPRTPVPHAATLLLAIIAHWDDFFAQLLAKVELDSGAYGFMLVTAAQAKNYTATVYLLEQEAYRRYIPAAFEACARMAARRGHLPILRHLLQCHPVANPVRLATVLQIAALRGHWPCVRFLLDAGVPVDVICSSDQSEERTTLLILVRYGQSRLLDTVTQVNRAIFGQIVDHPFALALRHGTVSGRMIRSLQRLGFDWLDSPRVLNVGILESNEPVLTKVWEKLQERRLKFRAEAESDRFALALDVLERWAAIGFVEEPTTDDTALICAVWKNAPQIMNEILDHGRTARTIDGVGILRGVVFEICSMVIISGKREKGALAVDLQSAARTMIKRVEGCTDLLEAMQWHQCTIDAAGVSVTVSVLAAIGQTFDQGPVLACTDQLNVSAPLHENLPVLQLIIGRFFSEYPVVYATFTTASPSTRHFWQIEDLSCLFDILPPGAAIDLTTTVNYGDSSDETPLHKCFPDGKLSLVKLLVENGANPLLADSSGMAAIHLSLLNAADSAIGRYLFDESVARDLRNASGASLLDLVDGAGGNRLLHTAVMTGRRDIIERLFQLRVDATALNSIGVSAVQIAAGSAIHNPEKLVKMLLEYDSSMIDALNPMGYTLLHYAAKLNSIPLLRVLLEYKPKLTVRLELTPLATAIVHRQVDFAQHLLRYAIENGIEGITSADDKDLVFHSCICNRYELCKALMEYELGHSLDSIEPGDLQRIDTILNGVPPVTPEMSLLQFVQLCGLDEAEEFVTQLQGLRNSITDQSATGAE
ncbi:uncharacterized protein LOC131206613 [Anopheles bellator]|uniref:uncharacterized protein LOC131206613 n=1 Tax=Anopheles bellator TaxID=139047 RepID=UPI0026480C3D|nr:uncharacterized protein LOC131206613 [Anopheles bellator]